MLSTPRMMACPQYDCSIDRECSARRLSLNCLGASVRLTLVYLARGHYDLLYQTAPQPMATPVNSLTATSPPCVQPGQVPVPFDFDPLLITIPNVTRQKHNSPPPPPCAEDPYAFPVQADPVSPTPLDSPPTSLLPVCRSGTPPSPESNNATDTPSELRIRMTSWTYSPFKTLPLSSMPVRK